MAKKLNTYVHVVERNDKNEITQQGVFGPADDLPGWARAAITNPHVWDGDEADDDKPAQSATGTSPAGSVPARSGPGSGADKWRAYAASQGVEVSGDASREDVIAALDAAGKPTQ